MPETTYKQTFRSSRNLFGKNLLRKRLKDFFEQTPLILFDRRGRIVEINKAAETGFSISQAEIIGKTLKQAGFSVIDQNGKKIPLRARPWITAISTQSIIHNAITAMVSSTGKWRWQQSTSIPIQKNPRRRPLGVMTIFSDITNLMELQSQTVQNQKMDAVAALANGLTHDFNNILTSVRSTIQLIMMVFKGEQAHLELLREAENETLRGAELIKQILLFTKPSGEPSRKTYLNHKLLQMRRLFKHTLPKNIRLHYQLSRQEFLCNINPTHFEQIFLNLVINSKDAMRNGGNLTITTSIKESNPTDPSAKNRKKNRISAVIQVTDDGCGIPPEIISRIFEPFFTTKKESGGTGLGLAIVLNLIRKSNGTIVVESGASKGTTFTVNVPARKVKERKQHREHPELNMPVSGYETILVVDDEMLIAKSTARFLERFGYSSITAFDGQTAVELFKKHMNNISIVLQDLEMPGLSGKECMEQMLIMNPKQKIIALSGHVINPEKINSICAGARLFVQKPFDSIILLQEIRKLIDSRSTDTHLPKSSQKKPPHPEEPFSDTPDNTHATQSARVVASTYASSSALPAPGDIHNTL